MNVKTIVFEACFLLVCSLYFYQSLQLEYGTLAAPGPGFLPVVLGFLGTIIVAVLLIGTLMNKNRSQEDTSEEEAKSTASYRPLVFYIMVMAVLILLFDVIGVIPGIFAATILFSKICGLKGWGRPLILGAVTAAALYTIFAVIFNIAMPPGILSRIL